MTAREATMSIVPQMEVGHFFWDPDHHKNVFGKFQIVDDGERVSLCCRIIGDPIEKTGSFEQDYIAKESDIFFQNPWETPFSDLTYQQQTAFTRDLNINQTVMAFIKRVRTVKRSDDEATPKKVYISSLIGCDHLNVPISKEVFVINDKDQKDTSLVIFKTSLFGKLVLNGDFRTKYERGLLPKLISLPSDMLLMTLQSFSHEPASLAITESTHDSSTEAVVEGDRLKIAVFHSFRKENDELLEYKYLITIFRNNKDCKLDPLSTYAKINYLVNEKRKEFIIPAYRIMVQNPDGFNLLSHYTAKGQNEVLETLASNANGLTIPMPKTIKRLVHIATDNLPQIDERSKLILRLFTSSEIGTH